MLTLDSTCVPDDTLYVFAFDLQQSVYWICYGGLPPFTLLTRIAVLIALDLKTDTDTGLASPGLFSNL